MSFRIIEGDCIEAMAAMEPNSVDAIVTDPPYGIHFMGKTWDRFGGPSGKDNTTHNERGGAMHAGLYDLSPTANRKFQEWTRVWATEALRVLKPGGHLLSSCSTRTYHRMAAGIEDAGFEIRDCLAWLYGSGFPKSLDVSKAIDKAAGAEREVVGQRERAATGRMAQGEGGYAFGENFTDTAPATPDAQHWNGWGTALKPAFEPIVLARKPLSERNVAANVLRWGTGALNIDGTRIDGEVPQVTRSASTFQAHHDGRLSEVNPAGRWPANVTLSHSPECRETDQVRKVKIRGATAHKLEHSTEGIAHSAKPHEHPGYRDADGTETVPVWDCAPDCAVAMLDEQSGERGGNSGGAFHHERRTFNAANDGSLAAVSEGFGYTDTGGASRFFYCPKADRAERNNGLGHMEAAPTLIGAEGHKINPMTGKPVVDLPRANTHPTVKPIALMAWLCRMVTPKGGTVLDPFTGSGSTGIAAQREGFDFIGIERDAEYVQIARARIYGDSPLFAEEVTG